MENKYEGSRGVGNNMSFIIDMSVQNFIIAQWNLCDFC